jgi:hypothetical protein
MNTLRASQGYDATATGWLTEQELTTCAVCHGYAVPPTQIEHWYKEDCLPHPEQRHILGQPGSRSYYPPHTAPQLLALCRLHERETRFPHLRFLLWLEGYDIPLEALRESLLVVWKQASKTLRATFVKHPRDSLAAAELVIDRMFPRMARFPFGRLLRRQMPDTDDRRSVLVMMQQLLLGGRPALESDFSVDHDGKTELSLAHIFVQAFGLKAAQTDRVGEVGPWLPPDVTPFLTMLSVRKLLSLTRAIRQVSKASYEQLVQARADREALFELLPRLVHAAQSFYGPNPFGMGLMADLSDLAADDVVMLAMQVAGLVVAREAGFGEGIDTLAATLQGQVELVERQARLHELIRVEMPDAAAALEAAMQSLRRGEHLHVVEERLREQASQFKSQFEAFWERHPELQVDTESDSVGMDRENGPEGPTQVRP